MGEARFGRAPKAAALLPLALLSIAWTASLATAGSESASGGVRHAARRHRDPGAGGPRPRQPHRAPHPDAGRARPGLRRRRRPRRPAASPRSRSRRTSARPRSSTPPTTPATCRGSWSPPSAGWSPTTAAPTATCSPTRASTPPGIFGPALDGTHGTSVDPRHRRGAVRRRRALRPSGRTDAVHPVDLGDRRGRRRQRRPAQPAGHLRRLARARPSTSAPGTDDLGTDGRRALGGLPLQPQPALRRPGAGRSRTPTCAGDYTSVPNGTTTTGFSFGTPPVTTVAAGHHRHHHGRHHGPHHTRHHGPATTTPDSGPTSAPTSGPTSGPTANPTCGADRWAADEAAATDQPADPAADGRAHAPDHAQAVVQCLAEGLVDNPLDPSDAFDRCVYDLTH